MNDDVKKSKPKSKEYPAITLNQAIEFVSKFKGYPHGKPISYDMAAKECAVSSTTKSFSYTISSAKQFGLISTSIGRTFTLLEPAYKLMFPTESDATLQDIKIECFSRPKLYGELISSYNGKSLPSASTIENVLINYHQILPVVAKIAAKKFLDSATELGLVQNGVLCLDKNPQAESLIETELDSVEAQDKDMKKESSIDPLATIEVGEFSAPLYIPFGDKRRAVLYMPTEASREDAEYVREMINLMLKRVYKVDE